MGNPNEVVVKKQQAVVPPDLAQAELQLPELLPLGQTPTSHPNLPEPLRLGVNNLSPPVQTAESTITGSARNAGSALTPAVRTGRVAAPSRVIDLEQYEFDFSRLAGGTIDLDYLTRGIQNQFGGLDRLRRELNENTVLTPEARRDIDQQMADLAVGVGAMGDGLLLLTAVSAEGVSPGSPRMPGVVTPERIQVVEETFREAAKPHLLAMPGGEKRVAIL
ncbi:Uncharacterised protein [uncultured archaeon]|nr:Uncharacterised protein [uncultured archaeon]